jgi:phosphoribosylformimino-5-aminoimidazole carboxamide ribonucleotide (ProFAR) isomerase
MYDIHLKPCRYCGADAVIKTGKNPEEGLRIISCDNAVCAQEHYLIIGYDVLNEKEAIAMWNWRHDYAVEISKKVINRWCDPKCEYLSTTEESSDGNMRGYECKKYKDLLIENIC